MQISCWSGGGFFLVQWFNTQAEWDQQGERSPAQLARSEKDSYKPLPVVEIGLTSQQIESPAWFFPEKTLQNQSFWFYITSLGASEKWERRYNDCVISGVFCGVYNRLLFMIFSTSKYILIASCTNKENTILKAASLLCILGYSGIKY